MVRFSDKKRKNKEIISDEKIAILLLQNGRMRFTEIAKKLGVSEGAVRKRIKKMEKMKIIKGYTAKIDMKKIGYRIDTIIGIDTKPEKLFSVIRKLKKEKNITQLWLSSGDHMIMLRCYLRDEKELNKFLEKLEKEEGIVRICPAILIEDIK